MFRVKVTLVKHTGYVVDCMASGTLESIVTSDRLNPEEGYICRIEASCRDFRPDPAPEYHRHGDSITELSSLLQSPERAVSAISQLQLDICEEA